MEAVVEKLMYQPQPKVIWEFKIHVLWKIHCSLFNSWLLFSDSITDEPVPCAASLSSSQVPPWRQTPSPPSSCLLPWQSYEMMPMPRRPTCRMLLLRPWEQYVSVCHGPATRWSSSITSRCCQSHWLSKNLWSGETDGCLSRKTLRIMKLIVEVNIWEPTVFERQVTQHYCDTIPRFFSDSTV